MRHMKVLTSRSKFAIIVLPMLAFCTAGAVWFLCRPDPPVWRLRTVFHIGTSINPKLVIEGSPNPESPIEHYRSVVAVISAPMFRENIANTSQFEASSAALSRRLVFQTLRPHALSDNDYDIEIDFTAGSAADCRSAYRAIADRIEQRHAILSDQNNQELQKTIDDFQERSVQLKAWEDAKQNSADPDNSKSKAWNGTRETLRRLKAIKSLMKPTTFLPEAEVYIYGPLSNNTVRLSALAGVAIIFITLVLALRLESFASKQRNTEI
jgi:hypothetical protein